MNHARTLYTDTMAVIGVVTAILFCGSQAIKTLTTTQGVSVMQYVAFTSSMSLNFFLAIASRKNNPGRLITQQIWQLATWSLCGILLIGVVIVSRNYQWMFMDMIIATFACLGFAVTCIWVKVRKISMRTNPAFKAWNSIFLKSIPQFFWAILILADGNNGLSWVAIVVGHVSIAMRLIPLFISLKEEGVSDAKKWLLISDVSNEVSWISVTVAWLIV